MTKRELINDMKPFVKGGLITRKQIAEYVGVHRQTTYQYTDGLQAVNDKYYFIPDIAERLVNYGQKKRPQRV